MKYNFDLTIDRKSTGSLKWDIGENEIPLWVADMDFDTAPAIKNAVLRRAEQGVFGYNVVTDEWYNAICGWWSRRHGIDIPKDALVFCTGVVPAISSAVRRLTAPNEKVIIQTPVYNIFFNSVLNNGRRVVEAPLLYEKGGYRLNIDDLEKKFADKETTLMILCNPHNPVGKIWTKEELALIGELSEKYSVTVISDEIHCDITTPGKRYVPYASVSEACAQNSVTCISATKAFNIAGLQCAAVYSFNKKLLARVNRALNTDEVAEPNSFAMCATVAAFDECEDWLDEMCAYTSENKVFVANFIAKNIPQLKFVSSDATYLCWVDCYAFIGKNKPFENAAELCKELRKTTGVILSEGGQFGLGGDKFVRINVACPKELLTCALERIKSFFDKVVLF